MRIEGLIQRIKIGKTKDGKDNYAVKIAGMWYGGMGKPNIFLKEGDSIALEYEISKDGKWRNIKTASSMPQPAQIEQPQPPPLKDRVAMTSPLAGKEELIIRECALYAAVELAKVPNNESSPETAIKNARLFEKYIRGEA